MQAAVEHRHGEMLRLFGREREAPASHEAKMTALRWYHGTLARISFSCSCDNEMFICTRDQIAHDRAQNGHIIAGSATSALVANIFRLPLRKQASWAKKWGGSVVDAAVRQN